MQKAKSIITFYFLPVTYIYVHSRPTQRIQKQNRKC